MTKPIDNKIKLIFIVKGVSYTDEFAHGEPLRAIVEKVLNETKNVGQAIENWEVKHDELGILDLNKHLKDYSFSDGTKLYLDTRAGGGGANH